MRYKKLTFVTLSAAVMAVFCGVSIAQTPTPTPSPTPTPIPMAANVKEYKLASKLMGREMPYRIVFPGDYEIDGGPQKRFAVIYLLHGLTGNYRNWTDLTRVEEYVRDHSFLIVTPEGGNGWYSDSVANEKDKYESYIIQELIPEIDKNFRTIATRDGRAVAGLSMGGYGAVKFGFKYPEKFFIIGTFSGALGVASFTAGNSGQIGRSVDGIFGPADSESRKTSDIFGMLREMNADKIKALPFIYQSCGNEDFLIQNNRDFMALLSEKKVPHEYRQLPGIHFYTFWDDQIREFLAVAQRKLKK
ncbi:MAG: esterase family protein [Acidobacteria bacterium]|nr:esterase family protein [Acidobacteriota bacterium]